MINRNLQDISTRSRRYCLGFLLVSLAAGQGFTWTDDEMGKVLMVVVCITGAFASFLMLYLARKADRIVYQQQVEQIRLHYETVPWLSEPNPTLNPTMHQVNQELFKLQIREIEAMERGEL